MRTPQEMLKEAAEQLKVAAEKYEAMKKEAEKYRNQLEAFEISAMMAERGMISPEDIRSTANNLLSSGDDLSVIKKAVEMNNDGNLVLTLGGGESGGSGGSVSPSIDMARDEALRILTGL